MQKTKKMLMFVDQEGNFSEHNTEEILTSKKITGLDGSAQLEQVIYI